MKRFLSFILVLSLCLSLSACGEVTVESVIEDARDFVSDVKNVSCSTMTGMDLSEGEDHATNLLNMDAELDFENGRHHMLMATENNGEQMVMEVYVSTGDTVDYFIGANDKWVKMSNIDEKLLDGVNPNTDLSKDFEVYFTEFLENANTEMTVEEIDGESYYKFYAPVDIDSLDKANKFGVGTFITGFLGEDAAKNVIATALEALGDIDVTMYISCDDYSPYGFVMDLVPALDALYKNIGVTNVTVIEAYSSSVYTDYGDSEVDIPENVLNAPDASSILAQQSAE